MRKVRNFLVLGCAAVTLAACGGDTAPQTVGGTAPAPGGSAGSGGGVGTVTPTPSGTPTPTPANFLDVAASTTFDAIGSFHSLDKDSNVTGAITGSLYAGNASTIGAPSGTVTYNPRDGIFTLKIADSKAGVTRDINFQDPAHRSTYSPAEFEARQIPNLANFNYLEVFDGTAVPIFFYQRPGTSTTYVSLGGFSRTQITNTPGGTPENNFKGERGVFVFGQKTPLAQIPVSGSGTFNGGFLASMITDTTGGGASFLQWINGTSSAVVDFSARSLTLSVNGTVGPIFAQGGGVVTPGNITAGSTFNAKGTAAIDLIRFGGFSGSFLLNTASQNNVGFTVAGPGGTTSFVGVDFASVAAGGATAGASSIDGAFFGPNGINLGGNFRIVGGVPNQRVDIMGAFTGAKQ